MEGIVVTFVVFFGSSFGVSSVLLKKNAHLHDMTVVGRVYDKTIVD
tara:strand:+ start:191 stop:328 length:138 start_codon:yes stop_codon:yes gene_type:complete